MDSTIRNLDEAVYRAIRARARKTGMTVGEAVTEAMRAYLTRPDPEKSGSIRDLVPEPWPDGNERSSEEIDMTVYGTDGT
jgi:plasmid stability protein